jgi:hypothetical protein
MGSIETQPTAGTDGSSGAPLAEAELANLRVEVERLRLKGEISAMQGGLRPWWRQGRSITAAIGLVAAIIPITTAVKGFFDERATRDAAGRTRVQEARDRYLDTVLKEPKNAQLILRYIQSTSEDSKIREWARQEAQYLSSSESSPNRDKLYEEAAHIVGSLAREPDPDKEQRFWRLYDVDLLTVESREFEGLMVSAGGILKACKESPSSCARSDLRNLGFQMSHQAQNEKRIDAIARPATTPAPGTSSN